MKGKAPDIHAELPFAQALPIAVDCTKEESSGHEVTLDSYHASISYSYRNRIISWFKRSLSLMSNVKNIIGESFGKNGLRMLTVCLSVLVGISIGVVIITASTPRKGSKINDFGIDGHTGKTKAMPITLSGSIVIREPSLMPSSQPKEPFTIPARNPSWNISSGNMHFKTATSSMSKDRNPLTFSSSFPSTAGVSTVIPTDSSHRTNAPSESPEPSPSPSIFPTGPYPSAGPTLSPKPSPAPSILPSISRMPSLKPTPGIPSISPIPTAPSYIPTASPAPSPMPSTFPSNPLPSFEPTASPAPSPTPTGVTPTYKPSVSLVPSQIPTDSPRPSPSPSSSPSLEMSVIPSFSFFPTIIPTESPEPSPSPTNVPSTFTPSLSFTPSSTEFPSVLHSL